MKQLYLAITTFLTLSICLNADAVDDIKRKRFNDQRTVPNPQMQHMQQLQQTLQKKYPNIQKSPLQPIPNQVRNQQQQQQPIYPRPLPQQPSQVSQQVQEYLKQQKQRGFSKKNFQDQDQKWQAQWDNRRNNQQTKEYKKRFQKLHPEYKNWFQDNFYSRYNYRPPHNYGNAWVSARWNKLNPWLNMGWDSPLYYTDKGYYVEMPQEYERSYYPTSEVFMGPSWMPLGVYTVGGNAELAVNSNLIFQLNISRDGSLSGTFYNINANTIVPMDGIVDRDSQLAVWRLSSNPGSPIISTSLYNLTQDETPIQVTFPNGAQYTWTLLRLDGLDS